MDNELELARLEYNRMYPARPIKRVAWPTDVRDGFLGGK